MKKKIYPTVCAVTGVATAFTLILCPLSLILSLIGLVSGSVERKENPSPFILGTIGTVISIVSLTVLYCLFRRILML